MTPFAPQLNQHPKRPLKGLNARRETENLFLPLQKTHGSETLSGELEILDSIRVTLVPPPAHPNPSYPPKPIGTETIQGVISGEKGGPAAPTERGKGSERPNGSKRSLPPPSELSAGQTHLTGVIPLRACMAWTMFRRRYSHGNICGNINGNIYIY
jgi:hypothetical protein